VEAKLKAIVAMRRLAASLVCIFLIYAGTVEALNGCLSHDGHSDHHLEGHYSDSGMSVTHDHSQSPSWPIIHCPTPEQQLGPAIQVVLPNVNRFDPVMPVHPSFVPEPFSPVSKNGLWREALFKRILTFSLNDIARHLFLSILQI
jgi:hypothetical protein